MDENSLYDHLLLFTCAIIPKAVGAIIRLIIFFYNIKPILRKKTASGQNEKKKTNCPYAASCNFLGYIYISHQPAYIYMYIFTNNLLEMD